MVKVNDVIVNEMATEYATTKNTEVFNNLFRECESYLRYLATSKATKAQLSGVYIPKEDFESSFFLALLEAADSFDPTKGRFIGRLNRLIGRSYEPDVWRKYRTKGNDTQDKDGKRYDKARMDSLDRTIDVESGFTLGEALLEPQASAEDEFMEKETIEKTLEDFGKVNERYAKAITLMYLGSTNDELAEAFGEREYNAKVRKLVQRAKESFRKFLYDCELA